MAERKGTRGKQNHTQMAKTINNDVLYATNLLEMKITLLMSEIGTNKTKVNLQKTISHFIGGKCIEEGYVLL